MRHPEVRTVSQGLTKESRRPARKQRRKSPPIHYLNPPNLDVAGGSTPVPFKSRRPVSCPGAFCLVDSSEGRGYPEPTPGH